MTFAGDKAREYVQIDWLTGRVAVYDEEVHDGIDDARGGDDAGFTLLEVLIAFAVLAVMLVPILQIFGGGLGVTQTARGYAEAALLARSKLAELGVAKLRGGQVVRRVRAARLSLAGLDQSPIKVTSPSPTTP